MWLIVGRVLSFLTTWLGGRLRNRSSDNVGEAITYEATCGWQNNSINNAWLLLLSFDLTETPFIIKINLLAKNKEMIQNLTHNWQMTFEPPFWYRPS